MIRLEHAGKVSESGRWHMPAHSHSYHQAICVLRGREKAVIDGNLRIVRAGEIIVFRPGEVHEEWADSANLQTYYVGFETGESFRETQFPDRRDRVRRLMEWLVEDRLAKRDDELQTVRTLLSALTAELQRLGAATDDETVCRVRTYIRENLSEPVAVDDLAAVAGISKYYFIRKYRTLAGATPMADVRSIRLDAARHLIIATGLPLKAIAPRVGFANEFHLSRELTREYGMSARQMRGV
jgi:AraC-like DNA-binding protein